jgi:hypothetical protein
MTGMKFRDMVICSGVVILEDETGGEDVGLPVHLSKGIFLKSGRFISEELCGKFGKDYGLNQARFVSLRKILDDGFRPGGDVEFVVNVVTVRFHRF